MNSAQVNATINPLIRESITNTTEELGKLKSELLESIKASTRSSQEVAQSMKDAAERMESTQVTATLEPEEIGKLKSELLESIQTTSMSEKLVELKSDLLGSIEARTKEKDATIENARRMVQEAQLERDRVVEKAAADKAVRLADVVIFRVSNFEASLSAARGRSRTGATAHR